MIDFIVNEIFCSINGEGTLTGELAIFIRLAGCNLRCSYCDTTYAQFKDAGEVLSLDEILAKVKSFKGVNNITLTGGEPLLHKNVESLLEALTNDGYLVNIETNGSVLLDNFLNKQYSDKLIFACDYKLPDSKMERFMKLKNLNLLREDDVLKFVIGSSEDFAKTKEIIKTYSPKCFIYLSAVFGKVEPVELVNNLLSWATELNTSKIRVQLQLHKYIWDPSQKGV